MSKAWTTEELLEDYELAGFYRGYEQAVADAQDALTRLLASSSTLFSDLQGLRAALIVVQRLSPDTNEIHSGTGDAETV